MLARGHSLPQSPRFFWSVVGIERAGFVQLVQYRKSAIHGLPVKSANLIGLEYETNTLRILRKSGPARALVPCHRPEGSWALRTRMARGTLM